MKKIKITEIGIKIGDNIIKLTPEETKDLYLKLKELFPETIYQPFYIPPVIIHKEPDYMPWTYPRIICSSSSNTKDNAS